MRIIAECHLWLHQTRNISNLNQLFSKSALICSVDLSGKLFCIFYYLYYAVYAIFSFHFSFCELNGITRNCTHALRCGLTQFTWVLFSFLHSFLIAPLQLSTKQLHGPVSAAVTHKIHSSYPSSWFRACYCVRNVHNHPTSLAPVLHPFSSCKSQDYHCLFFKCSLFYCPHIGHPLLGSDQQERPFLAASKCWAAIVQWNF